ncbi:Uncharacterised protein [Vibrio cholerae]|nr:Uncharacterised protein [Vibrio cholerae]
MSSLSERARLTFHNHTLPKSLHYIPTSELINEGTVNYCNNEIAEFGNCFAWARIEVPACCRI